MTVSKAGGTPRTITSTTRGSIGFDVDGAFAFFNAASPNADLGLAMIPLSGGVPRRITREPEAIYAVAVDARDAFYVARVGTSTVALLRVPRPAESIISGACAFGLADCNGGTDGCETNTLSDGNHCGRCGRGCGGGTCTNGLCDPIIVSSGTASGGLRGSMVFDGTFVYWSSNDGLMKAPLAGGPVLPVSDAAVSPGRGLATDGTYLYFGDTVTDTIQRMPLSGGSAATIASGQTDPNALTLDSGEVFWTTSDSVRKAPASGGAPVNLASGQLEPGGWGAAGILVDATSVYWVNEGQSASANGSIMKVGRNGTGLVALATGITNPRDLAADATYLYFADTSYDSVDVVQVRVMRVRKDGTGLSQMSWSDTGVSGMVADSTGPVFRGHPRADESSDDRRSRHTAREPRQSTRHRAARHGRIHRAELGSDRAHASLSKPSDHELWSVRSGKWPHRRCKARSGNRGSR
jgi:hypothetical protein